MKGLRRLLIAVVLFLVVMTGGAVLFWVFFPHTDVTKEGVRLALEKLINQPISLGNVHLGLSPTSLFDITLEDLAIGSPENQTLISVRKINLQPSILSLLKFEVLVSAITVEGLRVTITARPGDHPTGVALIAPFGLAVETDSSAVNIQEGQATGQSKEERRESVPTPSSTIKWQVGLVRLIGARVDFVLSGSTNNQDQVVSLSELVGDIQQETKDKKGYAFHLNGMVGTLGGLAGPFSSHGRLKLSGQSFPLEEADIEIQSDAMELGPLFRTLSDRPLPVETLTAQQLGFKFSFQQGKPVFIELETKMKSPAGTSAQLNIRGEAAPTRSFNAIEEIQATSRITDMPIQFIEEIYPESLPLKFVSGVLNGEARGSWTRDGWKAVGSLELERLIPAVRYLEGAGPFSASTKYEIDSQKIVLQRIEVVGQDSRLGLSGVIVQPLSVDPGLTIDYQGILGSRIIAPVLSGALDVSGSLGLTGTVRGSVNDLVVELNADTGSAALTRLPFFQKKAGTGGSATLSAHISKTKDATSGSRKLDGVVKGVMPSLLIGMDPKPSSTIIVRGEFQSRLFADISGLSLKDVAVTLFRNDASHKLLTASGSVINVGSSIEKFQLHSKLMLDKQLLTSLAVFPRDVTLNGTSDVGIKASGTKKVLDWSVNVPLNNIELKIGQTTVKPSGVPGNLAGVGKWRDGQLTLAKGEASVPGLLGDAEGDLLDRQGKFRYLNVEIKKANLAQIGKLLDNKEFAITGSLAGRMKIQTVGNSISTMGTLNATNVGIAQKKSNSIGCSGLKGALQFQGNTVRTEQLTGALIGVVEAPLRLRGSLENVFSTENLRGEVFVETGKGTIRTDFLTLAVKQTQAIGQVLGQAGLATTDQLLEVKEGTASIKIGEGVAQTRDLKIKGPAIAVGAIGSYRLKDNAINSVLSVQTRLFQNLPIGNIPIVQKFLKQNEGLLKASGLDKELGKFGIRIPDAQAGEPQRQREEKIAPTTIMFTLKGPIQDPQLVPVLESVLDKNTADRLKTLSQL